jgi:uncharacterized protein (DUF1800 family)
MPLNLRRALHAASVSGIAVLLMACGSNTGSNPASSTPTVSVTGAAIVNLGSTAQYAATVTGSSNPAVNWSVNQTAGGNAQLGTISAAGLYAAPASMPASSTITIAAVSVANSSVSGVIQVALKAASSPANGPATVTVTGPTTVSLGSTGQYSATVPGESNQSVAWSINNVPGGNSTVGTISATGLYTSPAAVPTNNAIIITATSVADPTLSGTLNASIVDPVPVITTAVGSTTDGGLHFLVDVQGSGFLTGATLLIGGQAVTTTPVSQNDLQTTVADPGAQPMQISVVVQNPTPGATQSTAVTVSLSAPQVSATAAARFLDQTSFGPTADSIAHVQQIGLEAALLEQFNQPTTLYSEPPATDSECASSNFVCTQSDFFKIGAWGNDQLRQRVAMALSEIWVAPVPEANAMPFYLNTLANDAFTNYRTIMQDTTLTPQMGVYLNMLNSGNPGTGQIANENFGREMMQLFSLGVNVLNPDGTEQTDGSGNTTPAYTELQVQAFARAYTGWTSANADGSTPSDFNWSTPNWQHAMVPVEKRHDETAKILLNGTTLPAGQTAEEDLKGALDNIFAHPNAGPFICRQLIQHLVTGNPSSAYVQRVSTVFANNGSGVRGDMKAVLTAIIMDQEARVGDYQSGDQAESSPAVDGGHLREPLLWTTNLLRGLGATQTNAGDPYPLVSVAQALYSLDEEPFSQQSVFNYFSPQYVVPQTTINSPEFGLENTGSIVPRLTLANYLIHNGAAGVTIDLSATSSIGRQASNPATLADYLDMLFMHSQMPTDMRSDLITAISAIPATDLQSRAEVAVYLVVTSSQYKIIH